MEVDLSYNYIIKVGLAASDFTKLQKKNFNFSINSFTQVFR